MKSKIYFGDEGLKESYERLRESRTEEKKLYRWISKAIENLEENAFSGIQIPKKQISKEYIVRYGIDNLWKMNLPSGWRLIYSVARDEVCIISIILEWMSHKKYEKRFSY